jgi:hypothetical protein
MKLAIPNAAFKRVPDTSKVLLAYQLDMAGEPVPPPRKPPRMKRRKVRKPR